MTKDVVSDYTDDEDDSNDNLNKLMEMFPQLSRTELLEVRLDEIEVV